MGATCAVLLEIGPGEREIERAIDTLESVWAHEPRISHVVVVDDEISNRDLASRFAPPRSCHLTIMSNPRCGRGDGSRAGTTAAVLAGLAAIQRKMDVDIVAKIDTDSLIIAPFAERVVEVFRAHPTAGIIGHHSNQHTETVNHQREVRRLRQYATLRRQPYWHVSLALWGRHARMRRQIKQAFRHGYFLGEHCQGGGYAVSREALDRMARAGALRDPLQWLDARTGEDVVVGIGVRSVGLAQHDASGPGGPFGVQWQGLPAMPEDLLRQGKAIIHSIKTDPRIGEDEIRAFFHARRPRREQETS